MDRQPTPVIIDYSKGWVSNLGALLVPEGGSPDLRGVEHYLGVLRRSRGVSPFSVTTLTGSPRVIVNYKKVVLDTTYLICITDSNIYKYNSATGAWDPVGAYAGAAMRAIYTTISKDLLIIADGDAVVMKYDGTTLAALGGLAAPKTVIRGKVVLDFWSHLLLMNTTEAGNTLPYRARWSNTGDPETWDTGNAGFQDLIDPPGAILAGDKIADRAFAWKERSIWEAIYVGYPRVFVFSPIIDGTGIIAPLSLVRVGAYRAFLGNDAFYMFDGGNLADISEPINDILFGHNSIVTTAYVNRSCAVYVEALHEIWLAVPVNASTIPNYIFRYSVKNKSWWHKYSLGGVYSVGSWQTGAEKAWTDLVGTWAAQTWRWYDSPGSLQYPLTLIAEGTKIKQINPFSGADEDVYQEAYWETKDYSPSVATRWVDYHIECRGIGDLELFYSLGGLIDGTESGAPWTSLGTKPVTTSEFSVVKWTFDVLASSIRFKVKWPEAEVEIRQQFASYIPHGRWVAKPDERA